MLIKLTQHSANVQVSVCLDLGSLQAGLDCEGLLQKVQCSAHLPNTSIVACHVVECHGHAQLVGVDKLLGLFQKVKGRVYVFFFQIIYGEDIANLAKLLAGSCEFLRVNPEMEFLETQNLLQDANRLHVF